MITLPTLLGVEADGKFGPAEALAAAWLRSHGANKQMIKAGRNQCYDAKRGRPGTNSTSRFDARVVGVIDGDRIMAQLDPNDAALLVLKFIHGRDLSECSRALAKSQRTISYRINSALSELARLLEYNDMV